jgi:hypothetical protein
MKNFFIIAIAIVVGFALLLFVYSSYKKSNPIVFSPIGQIDSTKGTKAGDITVQNWNPELAKNDGTMRPEITAARIYKLNNVLGRKYHVVIAGYHLQGFEGGTWVGFFSSNGESFNVEARNTSYESTGKMEFDLPENVCVEGYQLQYKGEPCTKSITIKPGEWAIVAKPWNTFSNSYLVTIPN